MSSASEQLKKLNDLIEKISHNMDRANRLKDKLQGGAFGHSGIGHSGQGEQGFSQAVTGGRLSGGRLSGGAQGSAETAFEKGFSQAVAGGRLSGGRLSGGEKGFSLAGGQAQYTAGVFLPPRLGGLMPDLVNQLDTRAKNDPIIAEALDKIRAGKRMTQKNRRELELEMADILAHNRLKKREETKHGGIWPLLLANLAPIALGVASKLMGKGMTGGSLHSDLLESQPVALRQEPAYRSGLKVESEPPVVEIKERPGFREGSQKVTFTKEKPDEGIISTGGRRRRGGIGYTLTRGDSYYEPEGQLGTMERWSTHGVSRNKESGSAGVDRSLENTKGRNLHNANGGAKGRSSRWIDHVKAVQQEHGLTYKEAMKVAKESYQP